MNPSERTECRTAGIGELRARAGELTEKLLPSGDTAAGGDVLSPHLDCRQASLQEIQDDASDVLRRAPTVRSVQRRRDCRTREWDRRASGPLPPGPAPPPVPPSDLPAGAACPPALRWRHPESLHAVPDPGLWSSAQPVRYGATLRREKSPPGWSSAGTPAPPAAAPSSPPPWWGHPADTERPWSVRHPRMTTRRSGHRPRRSSHARRDSGSDVAVLHLSGAQSPWPDPAWRRLPPPRPRLADWPWSGQPAGRPAAARSADPPLSRRSERAAAEDPVARRPPLPFPPAIGRQLGGDMAARHGDDRGAQPQVMPISVGSRWLRGLFSVYWFSGPGFDSLVNRLVGNNGRFTFALAVLWKGRVWTYRWLGRTKKKVKVCWYARLLASLNVRRIGSERLIFRPDIWRQDPQLHWYAIGFNTARSAAMYFFANSLDWERNFNFVQSMCHSLDFEECSKPKFKSVGLHFTVPRIEKLWDGSAHSHNPRPTGVFYYAPHWGGGEAISTPPPL